MITRSDVRLAGGLKVRCLRRTEARVLDQHVDGYFRHGISVREGDIVVDIGANIGLFALRALERAGGKATIHAFEPIPAIFNVLKQNAEELGGGSIHPVALGVARSRGRATFSYFPFAPAMSTASPEVYSDAPDLLRRSVLGTMRTAPSSMGWVRFVPDSVAGLIARCLRLGEQRVECQLLSLSEVIAERGIPRIDLLKIDAEGAELDILLGIEESDWPKIGRVVVEVHDRAGRLGEVTDVLRRHGFVRQWVEEEEAFVGLGLYNVLATRDG